MRVLTDPLSRTFRRVDDNLNSIKGGGACQLREKVLAEAAETYVPTPATSEPPTPCYY